MCSVSACRKVRKSALLSVSANVFHASAPLNVTIVPPLSLLVRNVSMSVNNTCCVRKVRPYIPLSVNTSRTLVDYVSRNGRHVQLPKFMLDFIQKMEES